MGDDQLTPGIRLGVRRRYVRRKEGGRSWWKRSCAYGRVGVGVGARGAGRALESIAFPISHKLSGNLGPGSMEKHMEIVAKDREG